MILIRGLIKMIDIRDFEMVSPCSGFHLCGGGRESLNECECVCVCVEAVVMLVMLDCRHRIKGCASVK
jgi:hypothetical protein